MGREWAPAEPVFWFPLGGSPPVGKHRLKSIKPVFIVTLLVMAVSLGLILVADNQMIWALLVVYGIARSVPPILVNIFIIEIPEIGSKYAGTAVGLANTVGMLGGFYIPPLGNSFAGISGAMPMVVWSIIPVLFMISLFFIKERGRQQKTADNT